MLQITTFEVGQGMSVLIDFNDKALAVIDCGSSRPGANPLIGALAKRLEKSPHLRIAFVLISHLDWDHINSFADLSGHELIASRIDRIFCNHLEYRTLREICRRVIRGGTGVTINSRATRSLRSLKALNDFIERADELGHEFAEIASPEASNLDRYPVSLRIPNLEQDFEILVWAPSSLLRRRAMSTAAELLTAPEVSRDLLTARLERTPDWNSASIILSLGFQDRRIFVCGDATATTWQEVFGRQKDISQLKCDAILAWHHGARLGTVAGKNLDDVVWEDLFLGADNPIAVISHGCDNRYGHPHQETINGIHRCDGKVFCTELRYTEESDWSQCEDHFRDVGLALQAGSSSKPSFGNHSLFSCCGNITLEADGAGVRVLCGCLVEDRQTIRKGCCQHGLRAAKKFTTI